MALIDDPLAMRVITVWTARVAMVFFMVGFALLGRRGTQREQRLAFRSAAVVMAVHLVALTILHRLEGEAPLAFDTPMHALVSLGGGGAAAVVLAGFFWWSRAWYRVAVYWPWGVFLFTYLVLTRYGDSAPRVRAAPLLFGPVALALVVAFLWRVRADLRALRARRAAT